MNRKLIALDGDGVLLDYGAAYPHAWRRAFGVFPREIDPSAYWPLERWDVERLSGQRLDNLRRHFDEQFWSSMAAIEGAVDATLALRDAGYELVCVSALEPAFEQARLRNLRDLGFPIERVIATSSAVNGRNPKAIALTALNPVAFVDDFLPYLLGLPARIHTALLRGHAAVSPDHGPGSESVQSKHRDLAAFTAWWLERQ